MLYTLFSFQVDGVGLQSGFFACFFVFFFFFFGGGVLFVSDGGITMSHYGKEILLPI